MPKKSAFFFLGVVAVWVFFIAANLMGPFWGAMTICIPGLMVILYYLSLLTAKVNELDRKLDEFQKSKVDSGI